MSSGSNKDVEVEVRVARATDKAILVETEKTVDPVWVPRSQVNDYVSDAGLDVATSIFVPEWLAIEKGLV